MSKTTVTERNTAMNATDVPFLTRCPHCQVPILRSQLTEAVPLVDGHTGPWLGIPNAEEPETETKGRTHP